MSVPGTVSEWHDDDGWGVVESEATPGGCWLHYSSILVPGHRSVEVGLAVLFTFEEVDQDGFRYRAVQAWPADREPVRPPEHEGGTMRSVLTLTFDDET